MSTGSSGAGDRSARSNGSRDGSAASSLRRVGLAARSEARQIRRDPILLVLVVVLPGYFVGAWGAIVPEEPLRVPIATAAGTVDRTVAMPELIAAVIAPLSSALLVGITALFAVQRSRDADRRLEVAGYRPAELLTGRLLVLGAVAMVVTVVAVLVTYVHVAPAHPLWFALAILLAGGVYGAVGALLGQVLDRLPGVYVLLFAPMIDVMLLQNPLADPPSWAPYLPGHHPTRLAASAAFADSVAVGHALWGVSAVVLAVGVAGIATTARMR